MTGTPGTHTGLSIVRVVIPLIVGAAMLLSLIHI